MTTLADVLPGALAMLGLPDAADRLDLPPARRFAVLLVDGFGYHLLGAAAREAPIVADIHAGRLGRLTEIASCFPSTTPTSLVSFGTGVLPGAHGIVGFTLNVPGTRRVLNHLEWRDDPAPASWQPVPTVFERAAVAGIGSTVVSRPEYAGSGLTVSAYRGARYVGTEALVEGMLAALADTPLVCGYHPTLDTAAHLFGVASPRWRAAAAEVGELIERLVAGLPGDAALLVTADHGELDIPAGDRLDVDADRRLTHGVRVIAGEPRVRYVHTKPGARDDVLAAWRTVLGGMADVVSREEAVAAGWFGPVRDEHLARIGDVVAVCRDRYALLASKHEPERVARLFAYHGAVTPDETAIPLIVLGAA